VRLSLLLIFLVAIVSSRRIRCWPTPYKKALLGISFFLPFLLTDGSATASQSWEGAPLTYWPVGLAIAILLYAGSEAAPLVFVSGLVAAVLNYHRNIFGWCGIPGVAALYGWYLALALALRRRWRIDPDLSTLHDVRRYVVAFLSAEFFSSITGMLTLLGDHLIQPIDAVKTTAEWWASDAIAILTFTPMLLVFVIPRVDRWLRLRPGDPAKSPYRWPSRSKLLEMGAQVGSGVLAIWIVFGDTAAIPYQPLYLLFIPLI
jgi:integral membrane sensor domain MASE1